jgi:hypothetical protein
MKSGVDFNGPSPALRVRLSLRERIEVRALLLFVLGSRA